MVDVSAKPATARRAVAEAFVAMSAETLSLVIDGRAAKGDVLGVAELAGVMGGKRTSELIPLCHPVALTDLLVTVTPDRAAGGLRVRAEAATTGQTGVEMEALTAASVAALTVYDMVKGVERGVEIRSVRLVSKTGGKSGEWHRPTDRDAAGGGRRRPATPAAAGPAIASRAGSGGRARRAERTVSDVPSIGPLPAGARALVVTVSDGVAGGTRQDESGVALANRLALAGFRVDRVSIADDRASIERALRDGAVDHLLVISTGGTGLTPRDVTPQATHAVIDYEVPGLAEAMRAAGRAKTPMADLSRGVVGVIGRSLVVNVPGSPKAALESLAALEPTLGHALETLAGPFDHGAAGPAPGASTCRPRRRRHGGIEVERGTGSEPMSRRRSSIGHPARRHRAKTIRAPTGCRDRTRTTSGVISRNGATADVPVLRARAVLPPRVRALLGRRADLRAGDGAPPPDLRGGARHGPEPARQRARAPRRPHRVRLHPDEDVQGPACGDPPSRDLLGLHPADGRHGQHRHRRAPPGRPLDPVRRRAVGRGPGDAERGRAHRHRVRAVGVLAPVRDAPAAPHLQHATRS